MMYATRAKIVCAETRPMIEGEREAAEINPYGWAGMKYADRPKMMTRPTGPE